MKLLRIQNERFEFELVPEERALLFHLLGLYPVVPATHHQLTRGKKIPNQKENQELLDEAIRSQRLANQRAIAALANTPNRFADVGGHIRASFTRSELDWLLQVLNDVRVGSWLALGAPDPEAEQRPRRDKMSGRHLMQMELAGGFEMIFLGAMNGTLRPEVDEV